MTNDPSRLPSAEHAPWREALTVPFILMTAFGDSASRDHARSLGALLFDKPFELDDLRIAVALLLRRDAEP